MQPPLEPKIYHIVHIDRLPSILAMGGLVSDVKALQMNLPGTSIGDSGIKEWRRRKTLRIYSDLTVGDCVPFYFCPRSVLLLSNHSRRRPKVENRDGQEPIVHLESDLGATIAWAGQKGRRWLFTDANAAMDDATEFNDLSHLDRIRWDIVRATSWPGQDDAKMAEFLVEQSFPWQLVQRIGVIDRLRKAEVEQLLSGAVRPPPVANIRGWYY